MRHEHVTTNSDTEQLLALEKQSPSELETVFLRGRAPRLESLAGWEYRGLNVPWWTRVVGIKKFVKGFFFRSAGALYGYNCPVAQSPLAEPWRARPSDEHPKRFGFFRVSAVDAAASDNRYLHAVLLDYGSGGNPLWDPTRGLRDYVVQLDERGDLLLGKAFYRLGPICVPTNFFLLQRHRPGPAQVRRQKGNVG